MASASCHQLSTMSPRPAAQNRKPCGVRSTAKPCSPHEYAEAWKGICSANLQTGRLPRMVDLLFIAMNMACEAGTGASAGSRPRRRPVPGPRPGICCWCPKATALPRDVAVAHPRWTAFDALWGKRNDRPRDRHSHALPSLLTALRLPASTSSGRDCQPAPITKAGPAARFPRRS